MRIRNDEPLRLVGLGGLSTLCRWSDRPRLVSQWRKVDDGIRSYNSFVTLFEMYSVENQQASHPAPMFKSVHPVVYQDRLTEKPFASIFNNKTKEPFLLRFPRQSSRILFNYIYIRIFFGHMHFISRQHTFAIRR